MQNDVPLIQVAANLENAWKMMKENKAYLQQLAGQLSGRTMGVETASRNSNPKPARTSSSINPKTTKQ